MLLTSPLFAPHELRVSPQHTHHPSSLNHPAGSHTAPCSAPLQRSLGELIFETFAFKQCVRKAAAELVLLDHTTRNPDSLAAKTGCAMVRQSKGKLRITRSTLTRRTLQQVVDSGFSFSHAYPVVNRGVFASAVKRCAYHHRQAWCEPVQCAHNDVRQAECWRQGADKPAQGDRVIPALEHDGGHAGCEPCML